ncbi:MAG TPA: hypothetical protein VIO62_08905 [Candidatus Dormibacteraeota bacterium]|jgi:hypothetical protein
MAIERPQISPDGSWWWDGLQWQPIATYPAAAPAVAAAPVPAAARTASADLDLKDLPSWLPAESAQVVLGGAATPAAPVASPALAASAAPPAFQAQLPSDGGSSWVQQTYLTDGVSPGKPRTNLLIGGAAFLVIAVALGGAFVYQQSGGTSALTPDGAHLSAAALLSGARASIGSAGSYHLLATSGGATQEITVSGPHDASIDLKSPAGAVSMMLTGGYQFLKAPAVFYADKNPVLAKNAADQWLIVPSDESLLPLTSAVNLAKTADCLVGRHGTLKKVGPATMDGQPVVEVDDGGEVPSGTPAKLYFTGDGGQLAGIDVVGASTPGGADPTCSGGLGIYSPTFSTIQKYRFDHWGSALNVRMPGGIDLTQKPWCGTIVGSGLNAAVQQFLLAAYTFNQKATAIEATGCGCETGNWAIFSQGAVAEINASDEYARSVEAIAFQGQANVDANAFVAAFRGRNALLRQGLASGTFNGFYSIDAKRGPLEDAKGVALHNLRADLGLKDGLCSYAMP